MFSNGARSRPAGNQPHLPRAAHRLGPDARTRFGERLAVVIAHAVRTQPSSASIFLSCCPSSRCSTSLSRALSTGCRLSRVLSIAVRSDRAVSSPGEPGDNQRNAAMSFGSSLEASTVSSRRARRCRFSRPGPGVRCRRHGRRSAGNVATAGPWRSIRIFRFAAVSWTWAR